MNIATCPECQRTFETVQGLGRHRAARHGVAGKARARGRTSTAKLDEVLTVLDVLLPKGVTVVHLELVNDWVRQTRHLLEVVRAGHGTTT